MLAEALRPYACSSDVAPRLGARALAGVVDSLIIGVPLGVISLWFQGLGAPDAASVVRPPSLRALAPMASLVYYLMLEGTAGASLGKRLFGLRVVSASGPPSFRRVLMRTLVFVLPGLTLTAVILWRGTPPGIAPYRASRQRATVLRRSCSSRPGAKMHGARSTNSPAARESCHGRRPIVGVCGRRNSLRHFASLNAARTLVRSSSSPMWARRIVAP